MSKLKVGIITQVRLTSERLPGKVLLPLGDKTLLSMHVDRLLRCKLDVYLALAEDCTGSNLLAWVEQNDHPFIIGSTKDVLARYFKCAMKYDLDVIVRVTSDCPLIDGAMITNAIDKYVAFNNSDVYLSNVLERSFPRGMDFEIFHIKQLEAANSEAFEVSDREHVTPWIQRNAKRIEHWRQNEDQSNFRLTVDTSDDYDLIRILVEKYNAENLDTAGIVKILKTYPELVKINSGVQQKKVPN